MTELASYDSGADQGNELLTGGLLVRVQPEQPFLQNKIGHVGGGMIRAIGTCQVKSAISPISRAAWIVGIAVFAPTPRPGPNLEWLIERADAALYIAKTTGRDQVKLA